MNPEIRKIIEYTAVAPSSHNTQPWYVKIQNNTIYLYADFSRRLRFSDPKNRELYISIGAALQNTLYACSGFGFDYTLTYFPKGDENLVASVEINFNKITSEDPSVLKAIRERHSNRNIYSNKKIPDGVLKKWKNLVKDLGVGINIISNDNVRKKLAQEISVATIEAMGSKDFRAELSKWVRHNLTKSHDGMPGYSMNIPTLISFLSPFVLKKFNVGGRQAKMEKKWIMSSPILVVLCGDDDRQTWVRVGQAYERVVLEATKNNIKSSTLTAAIEIGDHNSNVAEIIGAKKRPLVMFRFGYCDKVPKATPKRLVDEIIRS